MDSDELRQRRREAALDSEAGRLAQMVVDAELTMQAAVLLLESPHEERSVEERAKLAAHVLRKGLS